MYNHSAIAAPLRKEFGNDVSALCGFYRFYYLRIWQHRPVGVLEKIGRQLAIFYLPKCGAYKSRNLVSLTNEYRRGVASLSSNHIAKSGRRIRRHCSSWIEHNCWQKVGKFFD